MKTSNKKTHAFERAAAFITAAFIVLTAALVFTACPNSAGGGGGGGSTVSITVTGDEHISGRKFSQRLKARSAPSRTF